MRLPRPWAMLCAVLLLAPAASGAQTADPRVIAQFSPAPRDLAARFAEHLDLRDFGARCDGHSDDSTAFQAAAASAMASGRSANAAIEIDIPAGRCVLTKPWTITFRPNGALRIHGDSSTLTELQFNGGIDGLVVHFASNPLGNEQARQGRWLGQGIAVDGIHFVAKTGLKPPHARGGGEAGRAVAVYAIPLIAASNPPFQLYHDLVFSNSGGWDDRADGWMTGLYLEDADNVVADTLMFFDHALEDNTVSTDYWVHSTAKPGEAGHGGITFRDVQAVGGQTGLKIDGRGMQGINVTHLATVGVQTGLSWIAPTGSLSGSLTLDHNSMGATRNIVVLANISTVFSDHNFYYNVAPPKGSDPVFFSASGGDTLVMDGDQFYGPLPGYEGPGHQATALFVHGFPTRDVAPSVISGLTISHFDDGIIADGGPLHFRNIAISADTPTCYRDSGTEADPARHPTFDGIICGTAVNRNDGIGLATTTDWIGERRVNGRLSLGLPGMESPAGIPGRSGSIDWHFTPARTIARMPAYDCRDAITAGSASDTVGGGTITHSCAHQVFTGDVAVPLLRYRSFAVPTTPDAACTPGDSGDGVMGGIAYHFYCSRPNTWVRLAMSPGRSPSRW